MNRRSFLERLGIASGCILSGGAFAGEAREARAQLCTRTVARMERISAARRAALAANPDNKPPCALNLEIPEIDGIELDNGLSGARAGNELKVIAWNIERGREWKDAARLIQEDPALQEPDVILLSEMDLGMRRSGRKHTTRELASALGMNYAYAVEFLELWEEASDAEQPGDGLFDYAYHGNAILSRAPLGKVRALRFPGIERWYGASQNRLGGRIAVLADILAGDTPVTLISTHLESGFGDAAARQEEVRMIAGAVEGVTHPVILGGDFNTPPTSKAIEMLEGAGFCVKDCNDCEVPTSQYAKDGRVRLCLRHIDYIAIRNAAIVKDEHSPAVVLGAYPCKPEGKLLSDHAAVAAKVRIPAS